MLARILLLWLFATVVVVGGTTEELAQIGGVGPLAGETSADLARSGDHTFSVMTDDSVRITNVADKGNPVEVGMLKHSSGRAASVLTDGNLLYVSYLHALIVYDLHPDPAAPMMLHTFLPPPDADLNFWRGMTQSANHIYVSYFHSPTTTESLYVLAKGTLMQVGVSVLSTTGSFVLDMTYADRKVYATTEQLTPQGSVSVLDVSDPTNPHEESSFATPDIDFNRVVFHEGFLYISRVDTSTDMPLKINPTTGAPVAMTMPAFVHDCGDIHFYNSRVYLACTDNGLVVLEETAPNTFTLLARDEARFPFTILPSGGYLFVSDATDRLAIYDIPDAAVELVGGIVPFAKQVVEGASSSAVEDKVSGQRWERIPEWLAGSTAYMGVHGGKGMSLRLSCPATEKNHHHYYYPCTFYVTLHNCLPCSSSTNGGLPKELLEAGFEAAGCGPRYIPIFPGAPDDVRNHPAAIFKLQVERGTEAIELPVSRELLHVAVFVHSTGQQCSLKNAEACAAASRVCEYDRKKKKCMDKPMCPTRTGPQPPTGPQGRRCMCFALPLF
eukprot:TRINITY_DN98_c0_g1_i9.p1 TRINITY_DN98_c0_g1~~TRINITY_DN98_c0_g1_i9.p1  ORF type:complete len:555 (+),score=182.80 TRINITY_DN98_c0_g1_i9:49-1713(+)